MTKAVTREDVIEMVDEFCRTRMKRADLETAITGIIRERDEAVELARISDGTTKTVIQGTQDLSDEISKLIAERDLANTCFVCSAALMPRLEVPHCEDCIVTEDHEADYQARLSSEG